MPNLPTPSPMWSNLTVTRASAGNYPGGRFVDGGSTTLTVRASVQPAKSSEVQRLPEGLRGKGTRTIFCTTELKAQNETDGTPADLVEVNGELWEVQIIDFWGDHASGMRHWKAVAVRQDRN